MGPKTPPTRRVWALAPTHTHAAHKANTPNTRLASISSGGASLKNSSTPPQSCRRSLPARPRPTHCSATHTHRAIESAHPSIHRPAPATTQPPTHPTYPVYPRASPNHRVTLRKRLAGGLMDGWARSIAVCVGGMHWSVGGLGVGSSIRVGGCLGGGWVGGLVSQVPEALESPISPRLPPPRPRFCRTLNDTNKTASIWRIQRRPNT